MNRRKQTFLSFLVFAAALLSTVACAVNQQSRFQTAFLPPAGHGAPPLRAVAEDFPVIHPNNYLADLPPSILGSLPTSDGKTKGDQLIARAERRLEAGKRYYQAQDAEDARREFDGAVDLMLQASDEDPTNRQDYERRLDQMVDSIHRYDLAGLGASAVVQDAQFDKAPLEDILQMTFPVDPRLKDKVREQLLATESRLPLSINDAVLGYINYFSNRGHRTLVAATERSGRYRSMIQRILDEEGIPPELIHLAQAESGFMPRAMSRAAAGGMWQFLKWRGQEYGLQQTRDTDDRMDPEKATRAAARHLHDLYNEFGDWYLAIAAYNCGPVAVQKAVERTGYADFWELRARGVLPAETTNYVPIILAMTIMEKNPAEYGLDNTTMDPPVEYDTVRTTAAASLLLASDILDMAPAELAALNPAVLHGVAPVDYGLHVPKGDGPQLTETLARVPAQDRTSWRAYRMGGGESVVSIGRRFGASPAAILAANQMDTGSEPQGNGLLLIPVAQRAVVNHRSSERRTTAHVSRKPATRAAARHHVAVRAKTVAEGSRTGAGKVSSVSARPVGHPAIIVANSESR